MQKGFIFDLNKCTGCHACLIACAIENDLEPGMNWRQLYTYNEQRHPEIPLFHLSLSCNHCVDPPCMKCCPVSAYTKDDFTGAVILDQNLCIGCKYCSWVCPYDAPRFNKNTGLMEKCTLCIHRLNDNMEPACVSLCPTAALSFDNIEENGQKNKIPGFPETDIQPAIKCIPVRKNRQIPEFSSLSSHETINRMFDPEKSKKPGKISLTSELPLIIFAILAALLTGIFTASLFSPLTVNVQVFLMTGAGGILLSAMHLGKKLRSFRAPENWRTSWLSKEIALYIFFIILSSLYFTISFENPYVGWITAIMGFAAIFAMDKVYQAIPLIGEKTAHSAQVLITGLFLTGILSENLLILAWFGFMKIFLYIIRKFILRKTGKQYRPVISIIRLLFGFIIPAFIWGTELNNRIYYIVTSIIIGEVIDRSEYYLEMDIITPHKKMIQDMRNQLQHSKKRRITSYYR